MIPAVTKRMRPTRGLLLWGAALLSLLMAGCGGSSPQKQNTTTGLKKRVLLSNQFANTVIIVDAQNDKLVSAISVFGADKMVTASGITAVIENGQSNISVINNANEQVVQSPILPARAEDIAVSPDGKTIFAAVHNTGVVDFINSDGTINSVSVPSVSRPPWAQTVYLTFDGLRDSRTIAGKLTRVQIILPAAQSRQFGEQLAGALPPDSQPDC